MLICADAVITYARGMRKSHELAKTEQNLKGKGSWKDCGGLHHVPANAPRDFWEALQSYWFVIGVITELNTWDPNPGKLD